ncbi:Six-bladed beta-propeller [Pyrenophora seminiperda CCB06]|uniref:Six-bladed beta-propeller n=1 Tax=Pyrenophora seminiperda CCB06 TaxID=1302712 RepID=A0A3M7MCL9_9PLEO|nr:Six-bladed beta-propeller [Pyrenophora seminiperda CCB06]
MQYLAALAALAPWAYDRYQAFSTMLENRPGKLQNFNGFGSHEVKFRNELRNCEDVLVEEGMGIAFLSCNPERDQWNTVMGTLVPPVAGKEPPHIWIYDYSTPSIPDSQALKPLVLADYGNAADFQPLGIEFDAATSTLYVINHSRNSGNILEVFQVSVQDAVAKHVQTVKHPLLYTPNSIHSLGDGKLLVTNDHYIGSLISPLLSTIESFAGIPGGSVVYTDIRNTSQTKTLARIPFANGITMLNTTTVAVASSSKPGLYFYTLHAEIPSLQFNNFARAPSGVDNLAVDSAGKLTMAGHPFAPDLVKVSKARANCDVSGSEEAKKACECTAPSWAAEWSEEGGFKTLYRNSGEEFCSSSTFARDVVRGVGFVTGLYDRGILVVKE